MWEREIMRKPSDAVLLACTNLLVVATFGIMDLLHVWCCSLGSAANILAVLVSPILLLFTIAYSIRDFLRDGSRIQAVVALVLSTPSALLLLSTRL